MKTFIYPTWKTVFFSFTRNTPTAAGEEAHTNSSLYHVEHNFKTKRSFLMSDWSEDERTGQKNSAANEHARE